MIWPFMVPASKLDWTDERKCNAQYVYCFARERGFPAKILDVWRKMYPKNDESDDRWKKISRQLQDFLAGSKHCLLEYT